MEPLSIVSLASSIWNILSPYVKKMGDKLLYQAAEQVPELAGKLWNKVRTKMESSSETSKLPTDLVETPEDPTVQGAFQYQLKILLERDAVFAQTLQELLTEIKSETPGIAIVKGAGAIAQGQGSRAAGKQSVIVDGSVGGHIVTGNQANLEDDQK